jgi:EmrB/QacA subfamily drug resistance transporter
MGSVLLGLLLAALDQTVVGPAMPKIIGELKGFEYYTWVLTAYLLTSTIAVPIFGKLSDIYGRKWFYVGGIAVFLVGSMLAGVSADIGQLILYRAVQGIGAGVIFASAFTIVADLIPPANRGKWQGAFGAVFGLSSVIGPTIGGFLTDNLNWRWVFYVNLPVGLVAIVALVLTFPPLHQSHAKKTIDWLGALLLTAGLVPLLLALSLAGTRGALKIPFFADPIDGWEWTSPKILTMFAASAIFLALFMYVEAKAKETAIIPLGLFKNRIYTVSVITVFFAGVGFFSAIVYIPLFIQAIQSGSATDSGNTVTPMTMAVILASVLSGQIVSRTGKYRIIGIAGMALAAGGTFLLYTMNIGTDRLVTIGYMIIIGLGMGVSFPLYTLVTQNAFSMKQVGAVTAGIQFFRSIGGTVGIAILGSLVNTHFHDNFPTEFTARLNDYKATLSAPQAQTLDPDTILHGDGKSNPGIADLNPQLLVSDKGQKEMQDQFALFAVKFGGATPEQAQQGAANLVGVVREAMKPALYGGIQWAFLIAAIMLTIGLIATSFLPEIPLRKTHDFAPLAAGEGAPAAHAPPTIGDGAEEAGKEMAAGGMPGGTVLPAKDEPILARK